MRQWMKAGGRFGRRCMRIIGGWGGVVGLERGVWDQKVRRMFRISSLDFEFKIPGPALYVLQLLSATLK